MRKSRTALAFAAALGAAALAGPALADDNSMTPGYGDSWADLQAHNPAAATTPPNAFRQNGVVLVPSETVVVTPHGSTLVEPSSGVVVAPAPSGMTSEPSVAAPSIDPARAGTMPAPETELNTGHYIDSNGNPVVVPPANARPAR